MHHSLLLTIVSLAWVDAIGNYRGTWEQLVNALQRGENVPGNKVVQTNTQTKEGLEWYNVLHEEVHHDQLLIHGQMFENEFKKWMLKEAGKATSRKRNAVPVVEVVAAHELDRDSDSDEDDNSGG
jgi:hypothetical protein